ncbi:MAG: sigma 54-interacting transcriptional regulator, partial [Candidatus Eisenbacteria sp.]|nr:sigma 54-interacting transcriptional regulator [Candidatus Eisenbacteria bacterium]
MKRILLLVDRIAPTESTVLITGESGTGKEKVARLIHIQSNRSHGPFVPVNAGAIPEALIESELFGHARGAFTDAKEAKRGLFELADRGTLFLDEIAEMPQLLQVRLLRALQDGQIRPVGAEASIRVDVRVIAATNKDPRKAIAEGTFREDLFYRLNVFNLHIAPLRQRKEDIPYLANFFLARFSKRHRKEVQHLTHRAWGMLMNYEFPGNVRELENAIERAVILSDDDTVRVRDLPPEIGERGFPRLTAGEPEAAYPADLTIA